MREQDTYHKVYLSKSPLPKVSEIPAYMPESDLLRCAEVGNIFEVDEINIIFEKGQEPCQEFDLKDVFFVLWEVENQNHS